MSHQVVRILVRGIVKISRGGEVSSWLVLRVRKRHRCAKCDRDIPAGEEAYAPLGNQLYRAERLCLTCVEETRTP